MLAKYSRLRMYWVADQTLTYASGARIAIRSLPWKLLSGVLTYGTVITDDLGFTTGTIVTTGQVEGTVIDNTTNLYWGHKGYFSMVADASSTDGSAYLYLEESDDNTNWPSDREDFDITDLRLIAKLDFSTSSTSQGRAVNFEIN
jgi:hypothetical protein